MRLVLNLFIHSPSPKTLPVFPFEGRSGSGRSLAVEALCKELAMPLLRVDVEAMRSSPEQMQPLPQGLLLQQRLLHAVLYFAHADAFFDREGNPLIESYHFAKQLAQGNGPLFLACSPGVRWRDLLQGQRAIAFRFDYPDHAERRHLWQTYLVREGHIVPDETLSALAERFHPQSQPDSGCRLGSSRQPLHGKTNQSKDVVHGAFQRCARSIGSEPGQPCHQSSCPT